MSPHHFLPRDSDGFDTTAALGRIRLRQTASPLGATPPKLSIMMGGYQAYSHHNETNVLQVQQPKPPAADPRKVGVPYFLVVSLPFRAAVMPRT